MSPVPVHAAALRGVEAVPVDVEVSLSRGIPGIALIGRPDTSVLESRSRVRCALRASGFRIPREAVTVNLSPGDVRKTGTAFDLPIAVGILAATGQIPTRELEGCLFFGEVGLNGEVLPTRGDLAYLVLARELGLRVAGVFDPADAEAFGCEGVRVGSVAELVRGVPALADLPPVPLRRDPAGRPQPPDFADVVDQEAAKRACAIAAAGRHGLLMVGPPGSGKSMLARRIPGILPGLTREERSEAALIHSVAGRDTSSILAGVPPFAAPHHSVTVPGLIGGGRPVGPGEASLAHRGVLFLDELPEFAPTALQALRQPLEEGRVRLVRADGAYDFPCEFQLVAAANPCPCGYLGDPGHECSCAPGAVERYQSRVGGPLMSRIDLMVDVARPRSSSVVRGDAGTGTAALAEGVRRAREFRSWRAARAQGRGDPGTGAVSGLGFEDGAVALLDRLGTSLHLGGRSLVRIARVARTIADLEEAERVAPRHVSEASLYRSRDTLGGSR